MHELVDGLATGRVGCRLQVLGRVAKRDRLAQQALGLGRGGPRVTRPGEVADRGANPVRRGREEDYGYYGYYG